jgi:hypothetical protein
MQFFRVIKSEIRLQFRHYRAKYVDNVFVSFTGGKGGDGAISFLKEPKKPMGGPDGKTPKLMSRR